MQPMLLHIRTRRGGRIVCGVCGGGIARKSLEGDCVGRGEMGL